MSRAFGLVATALALLALPLQAQERGAAALANAVALLGPEVPRVLYIAAHPDDEDPRLIAWLSRGGRAEVAYLSLTRGDGGQNFIGDELGEALGVVRTSELLAARRIDNARQFFTRAYDFGFSKNAEEAYVHWPRDSLLNDVVRIVRSFRPHVIVATFSGTPRDGHGQHQVSGQLARDAYDLAGDGARFPRVEYGEPWMPLKLYRIARSDSVGPILTLNVGEYDPISGMSYDEISSQSRSQHKSQGLRGNYRLGEVTIRYWREASRLSPDIPREREQSMLDGIAATARTAGNGRDNGNPAASALDVRSPATAIPYIARHAPPTEDDRSRYDRAAVLAAGLAFEAIAPRSFVAVGDTIVLDFALHNRGTVAVRIDSAAGPFPRGEIAPGQSVTWKGVLRPMRKSQPWWLALPRVGDMFAVPIPGISDDKLAQAEWLQIKVTVSGLSRFVRMNAQPIHRLSEGFYGDALAPLTAAPGLTVTPVPGRSFVRADTPIDRDINLTIRSSFDAEQRATVRITLPTGLVASPATLDVLLPAGATRTVSFRLSGVLPPGQHDLRITAEANGRVFNEAVQVVDYPHIVRQQLYRPSDLRLTAVTVATPDALTVGYVAGRADEGPRVLRELGIPVTLIEPAELARQNLSRFATIVVGPRMYEVSRELVEHNGRLLEYAGNGGRLVVQVGQYMMAAPGILPYPITISRPPDRVTDEIAPVVITDPAARELTRPNRITLADFEGWVQERATFMPDQFDPRYRTMLAMNDPGEQPVHTAILVAPLGRGKYVFTSLALFRQLEEGVPGAVRLFINLLTP